MDDDKTDNPPKTQANRPRGRPFEKGNKAAAGVYKDPFVNYRPRRQRKMNAILNDLIEERGGIDKISKSDLLRLKAQAKASVMIDATTNPQAAATLMNSLNKLTEVQGPVTKAPEPYDSEAAVKRLTELLRNSSVSAQLLPPDASREARIERLRAEIKELGSQLQMAIDGTPEGQQAIKNAILGGRRKPEPEETIQ